MMTIIQTNDDDDDNGDSDHGNHYMYVSLSQMQVYSCP